MLNCGIFGYLSAAASSQIGDEASIIAFPELFNSLLKFLRLRGLPHYETMIETSNLLFSMAKIMLDAVLVMQVTIDIIAGK